MSDETEGNDIELAQRAIDVFNRRDFDALLSLVDPEVEFFIRVLELEGGGPFRGHAGLRTWWQDLLGVSPDLTVQTEDVRELGDVTVDRNSIAAMGWTAARRWTRQPGW